MLIGRSKSCEQDQWCGAVKMALGSVLSWLLKFDREQDGRRASNLSAVNLVRSRLLPACQPASAKTESFFLPLSWIPSNGSPPTCMPPILEWRAWFRGAVPPLIIVWLGKIVSHLFSRIWFGAVSVWERERGRGIKASFLLVRKSTSSQSNLAPFSTFVCSCAVQSKDNPQARKSTHNTTSARQAPPL